MCMSPDRATNAQLQEHIEALQRLIDEGKYPNYHERYKYVIKKYEAILKERAEDGTYANH